MLRGLAQVIYWADDVDAVARWYAELLGVEPYFARPGPEGAPAYVEFRLGDFQAELGIIDRRYAPPGPAAGPGGVIANWHVDDVATTVEKLLAAGATEYSPITTHAEGFVTAAVVDPFGNVLGVMYNLHYLEVLGRIPSFTLPEIKKDIVDDLG